MAKQWEILRKRIKIRLFNNARDYKKYVSKPIFFHRKYLINFLLLFIKLNQF